MLHKTAYLLVIVGALNWGLIGLFNFNLVMALFGGWPMLEKIVYILVGLSAVYDVLTHGSYCCICDGSVGNMNMGVKGSRKRK